MAGFSGLYYPHTTALDESVLRTALLLWDEIQFIVPFEGFTLRSETNDTMIDEAYELIGKTRVPILPEQLQVHEQVIELLTDPNCQQFLAQVTIIGQGGAHGQGNYEIYPQKFLGDTWQELQKQQLVTQDGTIVNSPIAGSFQDYVSHSRLGLLLMLYLAQACAGETRRLITDQTDAYNGLNEALAASAASATPVSSDYERLVTRSMKIVDPGGFSLKQLIELRRAEAGTHGHHLRKMRHNYLEMIDRFVTQLTQTTEVDLPEIERLQEREMADCLAELKDALKLNALKALHEKEVFIAMVAAAGMLVAPVALPAGIASVIALNNTRLKFKEARRKVMTDHAMSWLLQASTQGQMTMF